MHEFRAFAAKSPQYEIDLSTFPRTVSSTPIETIFPIPHREKLSPVEKWFMKSKMKIRVASLAALLALSMTSLAYAAQAPSRFVGTITEVGSGTLTVKTDAGEVYPVEIPSTAALKRVAPGQKDLNTAETIQFTDLAVGDRALVKLDPDAPAGKLEALQVVAIKESDVALKQQKDREDWQRRGVGGLVKSVDAAAGAIVLSSGSGPTAKTVTVHIAKTTMLKRYAPTSVRFDAALPAPIDAIHAGDQLRARGEKNAAGTEIAAEEVVSGAFKNVSGMIVSIDIASSTLVVKDLATKKPVTIHITADAQMRRLPDRMASMLAMALKGTTNGAGAWSGRSQAAGGAAGAAQPGAAQHGGAGQSNGMGGQSGAGGGDPQQAMLGRAPAIQIADLKKDEAVMLVSTEGTTDVTAITLLAGVEPLLAAPAASQNMLSNWSMSGGGADSAQ